jgi:signal peptidase I
MPDDRDADVGPAPDREDLFGPAPSPVEPPAGRNPDRRSGSPASPTEVTAESGEQADAPDAPLFPTADGASTGSAHPGGPVDDDIANSDRSDESAVPGHAPREGSDAPREGSDAPREGSDAPREGSDAPGEGSDAPREGSDAPGEGSDAPGEGSDAPPEGSGKAARGSTSSFFRELPVLLLVAFLLAFLLRTFVLQVFFIPSGSMEPTLQIDDRMVVEKITYLFREPVRGEIVVFEGESFGVVDPDATAGERIIRGVGQFLGVVPTSARDYVKRVIGLPGDEIVIEDGEVRVNDELLEEAYVVFEDPSDFGPVTVPDGHLFFLGDNRPNSADSRRGLGFVPVDAVVGRSAVIIWPFDHVGLLTGVEHDVQPAPEPSEATDPSDAPEAVEPTDGTSDVEDEAA